MVEMFRILLINVIFTHKKPVSVLIGSIIFYWFKCISVEHSIYFNPGKNILYINYINYIKLYIILYICI